MDRKTLLAISICFLIFVGWQEFYLKPVMKQREAYQQSLQAQSDEKKAAPAPAAPSIGDGGGQKSGPSKSGAGTPRAEKPAITETLATADGTAKVSNSATILEDWDLRDYVLGISQKEVGFFDRLKKIVFKEPVETNPAPVMGDLRAVTGQTGAVGLAFDSAELAYLTAVRGDLTREESKTIWKYEDDKVATERVVEQVQGQPYLKINITTRFKGAPPKFAFISLAESSEEGDAHEQDRTLQYWTGQDLERVSVAGGVKMKEVRGPIKWIGAANRYFLFSLVDETGGAQALVQPLGPRAGRLSLVYPVTGNQSNVSLKAFFGPKKIELLRKVEPTLDHTVNFGFFTILAYPLLQIMKWFFSITQNWGVAIILLTIVVRIAVLPLAWKSAKSMKQMAKVQPQIARLKEKYKDDKDALNRETIALMRGGGYNPIAGCLPLLVQMPIFFALYQVLYSAIELYQAPFMLWIQDLSEMDPYFVTPLLLTGLMWFQMKLTPTPSADPAQVKMMQWMPLIFGVMMLSLPSGLAVYMLISTVFGIAQQKVMNKKLGLGAPALVPANAR